MCVSFDRAAFTGTVLCLSTARHPELDRDVRVLVYANMPENRSPSGANAMFLHFPSTGMTAANVIDTTDFPYIAEDLVETVKPRSRSLLEEPACFSAGGADALVFDSGIYTVVLASHVSQIPEALLRVPENKRPALNQAILDWYNEHFPGWSFALCCFDSRDAEVRAAPLLWWYEQTFGSDDPDEVVLPGVDAHTGDVPNLSEDVDVDHWVIVGSSERKSPLMQLVNYGDDIHKLARALLPKYAVGQRFEGQMKNGDFVGSLSKAFAEGTGTFQRRLLTAHGP
jgi:hypothetical protein